MSDPIVIALIVAAAPFLAWLTTRRTAEQVERAAERAHWAAERAQIVSERAAERIERIRVEAENDRLREALDARERAMRRAGVALPDDTPVYGTPAQGGGG